MSEEWKSCPSPPSWAQAKALYPCRGVFYYWRSACRGWSQGLMLCVWNFCGYFLLCQWKAGSHPYNKKETWRFPRLHGGECFQHYCFNCFTFPWLPCIAHSANAGADVTGDGRWWDSQCPFPKRFLAVPQLGWSVAGLFYSLIVLHWVKISGFGSSLTVSLSGAGLCWEDEDEERRGGYDCFLPSLDQLGDLKQALSAPQAYLLSAYLVSQNRSMAKLGIEALLRQVMHTGKQWASCLSQISPKLYAASSGHFRGLKGRASAPTKLTGGGSTFNWE